jgi:hypothetical protein
LFIPVVALSDQAASPLVQPANKHRGPTAANLLLGDRYMRHRCSAVQSSKHCLARDTSPSEDETGRPGRRAAEAQHVTPFLANAEKTVIDDTTKAELEGLYDDAIAEATS